MLSPGEILTFRCIQIYTMKIKKRRIGIFGQAFTINGCAFSAGQTVKSIKNFNVEKTMAKMIGSWTTTESEDLLIYFLTKESVYREFMLEIANRKNSFHQIIEVEEPQNYVKAAFYWTETERGRDFWKEINNKWVKFYIGFTYDIEVPFII